MSDAIPLDHNIRFGVTAGAFDAQHGRETIETIARCGYDSVWAGDHIAFTGAISDPLAQLIFFSALQPALTYGTGVYLLPLRHPTVVAKMVATVDRLLGAGHFVFGVGVGGEFPPEYEACGVPLHERGGRASEAIQVIKRLWTEDRVAHRGKYFSFGEVTMEPKPLTPGGPPVWIGGRAEGPLKRAARLGDGWMPYVVTPKRYADGLDFIGREADRRRRRFDRFGTGLFIFCTLGQSYEGALDVAAGILSRRYAMNFRGPAARYGAIGRPSDVAEKLSEFRKAGVRDFIMDIVSPVPDRDAQLDQFAKEVIPLLRP